MSNFDKAFELLIDVEGGYSNDPRDPGGETKFGITKRQYPDLNIATLTVEDAKAFYQKDYWLPVRGSDLPWPLALFVFDCAVNQGAPVAVRLLQKSADTVQDGVLGQNTLRAIAGKNQGELCALFMADRALRYTGTRNFDTFGRGWLKRLFKIAMEA